MPLTVEYGVPTDRAGFIFRGAHVKAAKSENLVNGGVNKFSIAFQNNSITLNTANL